MLSELLYPLKYDCCSPLHNAASQGHATCVDHLLSTPGIDVNIKDNVSGSIKVCCCCAKEQITCTCTTKEDVGGNVHDFRNSVRGVQVDL